MSGPVRVAIFDLDGTLADARHRLHLIADRPGNKKDWPRFHREAEKDAPIKAVVELAHIVAQRSPIVICSGRTEDDDGRSRAVAWLKAHNVHYEKLYMRAARDYRKDDIIKMEMLAQMRADGFEPWIAFDDRPRICQAWRSAGIVCLQNEWNDATKD